VDRDPLAIWKSFIREKIMRQFIVRSAVLAGLAVMPATSFAAETYTIDPAHVFVTFGIKHGPFGATVLGRFDRARDDVTRSSVKAAVDATTIDTNFARRDADLKGPDFLNAAEFPAITFVSTRIERTGDRTGTITGDLTLMGVTKPMVLKATFAGEAPSGPASHVGFSAVGEIDINDFQLKKAIQFGFGPKIEIRIEAEANRK
jgi:polyisoprenoid-binding protein YceI